MFNKRRCAYPSLPDVVSVFARDLSEQVENRAYVKTREERATALRIRLPKDRNYISDSEYRYGVGSIYLPDYSEVRFRADICWVSTPSPSNTPIVRRPRFVQAGTPSFAFNLWQKLWVRRRRFKTPLEYDVHIDHLSGTITCPSDGIRSILKSKEPSGEA